MVQVWGTGGRRVLGFALASLVPAAAVTLLVVNQPSIADQRVFPILRLPLAVLALALALGAVVSWVVARDRLSRPALTGLAIVGVTTLLCIGPLTESSPQPRLYALDLRNGRVVARTTTANEPDLSIEDLVIADQHSGPVIGSGPEIVERGCDPWTGDDPPAEDSSPAELDELARLFPGESVPVAEWFHDRAYVYVASTGADGRPAGAIAAVDPGGIVKWRRALPAAVVADRPAIDANAALVAVAGGGRIGTFSALDGGEHWTVSVVSLGKSRRYALPGAVQDVVLTDCRLFLSLATE
jgi:hypothetical protein